jgi:FixJ family two-component response regulator
MIDLSSVAATLRGSSTLASNGLVFVVVADVSLRESVEQLLECAGWRVEAFATGREFLSRSKTDAPSCLVLDADLADMSGLEVQQQLTASGRAMPTVFIAAHGDVPTTVLAMRAGAIEFLTKPFVDAALLLAVEYGIERSQSLRACETEGSALRALRLPDAARASGDGARDLRAAEQAGRRRAGHQRDHGQGAARAGDEKD